MRYSLCTRTEDKDYTWYNSAPVPLLEKAQEYFGFFDGGIANEFAVLFRLPACGNVVSLLIAVPTARRDNRGRIIRSIAMLYSENQDDAEKLASFYSCILKTNDESGLKNANSDIALAIEEIVTTKGKSFERLNKLSVATRLQREFRESAEDSKKGFPRADMSERKNVAAALGTILDIGSFFIAIPYYRKAKDFVAKFDLAHPKMYVRIFSPDCTVVETIPTDCGKKMRVAIGVGALAVGIAATVATCSRSSSDQEASSEGDISVEDPVTNNVETTTNNAIVETCTNVIEKTAQVIQSVTNNVETTTNNIIVETCTNVIEKTAQVIKSVTNNVETTSHTNGFIKTETRRK